MDATEQYVNFSKWQLRQIVESRAKINPGKLHFQGRVLFPHACSGAQILENIGLYAAPIDDVLGEAKPSG